MPLPEEKEFGHAEPVVFVNGSVRIAAADRAERDRLLRLCASPPFALERLPELDCGQLIYYPPKPSPGGSGLQFLTPLERLDRFAALVSPLRIHRHRYFGVHGPNAPLRTALTALAPEATTAPLAGTATSVRSIADENGPKTDD